MKVIIGGDAHFPFQHNEAVDEFLAYVKKEKPDALVLLGDIKDAYHLSSHLKKPTLEEYSDVDENVAVRAFLQRVWDAVPFGCEIHYLCGNHEIRLEKYVLRNAAAIYLGGAWRLPEVLRLDSFDITWHKYGELLELDGVFYTHGELISGIPGNTVRKHILKFGRSMVVGHCHRGAVIHMRLGGKLLSGMETGCLCRETAGSDYVRSPDWALGFGIVRDGVMEFIKSEYQL